MKIKINICEDVEIKDSEGKPVLDENGLIKTEEKIFEKEVEIKGLKGKHKVAFVEKVSTLAKKSKGDRIEAIGEMKEFLEFQDEMAVEVINLTKEEYQDLELEESNKILLAIRKILFPGSETENVF